MQIQSSHSGFVLSTAFSPDSRTVYFADGAHGDISVLDIVSGTLEVRHNCHGAAITALAAPTRHALVSASFDGTAALWDGPQLRRRFEGHDGGVHAVALSTAGAQLATAGFDGQVLLHDLSTGKRQLQLAAHNDAVTAVVFITPDTLATASRDHSVRIWNTGTGTLLRQCDGHDAWVTRLAAVPGTTRVLSTGEDGRCCLWDSADGTLLWQGATQYPIWGAAVAPDGTFAVTSSNVCRWDLATGAQTALPALEAERAVAVAPDSRLVALGSDRGRLVVYDALDGVARCEVSGERDAVLTAVADAAGRRFAVGYQSGAVRWGGATTAVVEHRHAHQTMAYAMTNAGTGGFASAGFDGRIQLYDFAADAPQAGFEHPHGSVFSLRASNDGATLFSCGSNAWCLWDVQTGQQRAQVANIGSGGHTHGDLSADGSLVATAGKDALVRIWDGAGTLLQTLVHAAGEIADVRWQPGARAVLLADARGRVWLADRDTERVQLLHAAHEDWIRQLLVTADGRYVVSASQNFRCAMYDLQQRCLITHSALAQPHPAAAVAADGAVFLVDAPDVVHRVDVRR